MRRHRIALIGCGRIAGHHGRAIRKHADLDLAAVCDLVPDRAEAYAKEFGVPSYRNYREMLAREAVDVVVIATPSGMHFEHACEVLERFKKHVVVEKPTFLRPSHLREAFAIAERLGLHIFPVFQNRHNLAVRRVARALREGELGALRILSVRVRWCRPQRYYEQAPWRGTFAQDGGALTNQGVHHVDLVRQLGGEVRRVCCRMKTLGADIEVEDTAVATLEFESGAVGVVEVTTAARPDDFEASLSLVCERGLAQLGGIAVNELQIFTPDPRACTANSEDFSRCVYGNGHEALYGEVAGVLSRGERFSVHRDDALGTIALLHAFYRSDEEGTWIQVTPDQESPRLGKPDEELARLYRT